jgi:iron complex transport system ATP-binding protein
MEGTTIQIRNLCTGFKLARGKVKRLQKGLNLELVRGELICVLGPNGSGKSILLKTLLGFLKPLEGEILIDKKPITEISIRDFAKLVSVVLTNKIDDFYLTAFEVALTGRYPHGSFSSRISKTDKEIVENTFDQLGISNLLESVFSTLSDGEKQKVMIARAIVQDTPFIFMDEPVAFIDSPGKVGIMHLVKKLTKEFNKGVLMATHDIEAAIDYADQLWLLGKDGNFEKGLPQNLIGSGSLNRFFDQQNITFDKQSKRFTWKG